MGVRERLETAMSIILIICAVIVALAAGRLLFDSPQSRNSPREAEPELLREPIWAGILSNAIPVTDTFGSRPVTVVEFMDLECPFCRRSHLALEGVADEFVDSVAHFVVHYPLDIHRFARPAARAAECAALQDRFAEYVHVVFLKQDSLGLKDWSSYANESGIRDAVGFQECVAQTGLVPRVEDGLEIGEELDVQSTPTVIINGWRLGFPPRDTEGYIGVIRDILAGVEPYAR